MPLLVISFDGISDTVFEEMAQSGQFPSISRFKGNSTYVGGVKTVFVSNTYPIHTSVSTGKLPKDHGITSNILQSMGHSNDKWAQLESLIKSKTIWQAAKEKGLKTAAFLWPVTCGAKINYHIPEVHLLKSQNRILSQLKHGSKLFQLKLFLKYRKQLAKIQNIETSQPTLDNFITASVASLLKKKKPSLTLVHLIAYDTICHEVGPNDNDKLYLAKKAMDDNLAKLLRVWKGDILIFSDHSQLSVNETINLNVLYNSNFVQMGGCAFGNNVPLNLENQYFFGRYLTKEEMHESGYAGIFAFGIAAKSGFSFGEKPVKGDHGYPTTYENYNTFYAINKEIDYKHKLKNSVLDVTAIIAKELGIDMDILQQYDM